MKDSPSATSRRRSPFFSIESAFLAASLAMALVFLGFRNIYDDEVGSFQLVGDSIANIVRISNSGDLHPPGMYVLSHLAYMLIPSPRWMTILPLLAFYSGLAAYVFAVGPLFAIMRSRACFLILATLHPQLVMWSNSIRWYGWWTGIALLALTIALQPREARPPRLTCGRALLLGLLLACLFYLNYITLLFAAALGLAVRLRYSGSIWRQSLVALGSFLLLIAPQLHPFFAVHMAGSRSQRGPVLLSAARIAQSLAPSEAYLPWHPLAVIAVLAFAGFAIAGLALAVGWARDSGSSLLAEKRGKAIFCVLCFGAVFFALAVLTGLGVKPRNALLLIPALAPAGALVFGAIQSRGLQNALLGFFAVWSAVGLAHLIGRQGTFKGGMNDRPEEVLDYVSDSRGAGCSVTMTYDPELTFLMARSGLARSLVLGYPQNSFFRGARGFAPSDCTAMRLYIVRSYTGGYLNRRSLLEELARAQRFLDGPVTVKSLGYDPDAGAKRRLSRLLPASLAPLDYRYVVSSGAISRSALAALESQLEFFVVEDGVSQPEVPARAAGK